MELSYHLTQKDFHEAFIAHRNGSFISRWTSRLLVSLVVLFAILGLAVLVDPKSASVRSDAIRLFLFAGAWAAIVWGLPWWSARNQFLGQPAAQGVKKLRFDAAGLHLQGTSESSDIQWDAITRWLEAKNQILLYSSPACFNIIPKRAFSPDQLTELRGMLAQHIQGAAKKAAVNS